MTAAQIQRARTFLFVPAHRPDRFARAIASGADAVVIDLEDAVAPEAKAAARQNVIDWLNATSDRPIPVVVRINDPRTPEGSADVEALATAAMPIMVPKADDTTVLTGLAKRLGPHAILLPLVETSRGVLDALHIAASPAVARLALGHLDLAAELGIAPDADDLLAPARFALTAASAALGLPAPIDGVTASLDDKPRIAADTVAAVRRGFSARLCIHPAQVPIVHEALLPHDDELTWARRVLAAVAEAGGGVCVVDGRMVDRPVELRAASIVARAPRTRTHTNFRNEEIPS